MPSKVPGARPRGRPPKNKPNVAVELSEEEDVVEDSDANEGVYEVKSILDHYLKKGKYHFVVRWVGGPKPGCEDTKEPLENLKGAESCIRRYFANNHVGLALQVDDKSGNLSVVATSKKRCASPAQARQVSGTKRATSLASKDINVPTGREPKVSVGSQAPMRAASQAPKRTSTVLDACKRGEPLTGKFRGASQPPKRRVSFLDEVDQPTNGQRTSKRIASPQIDFPKFDVLRFAGNEIDGMSENSLELEDAMNDDSEAVDESKSPSKFVKTITCADRRKEKKCHKSETPTLKFEDPKVLGRKSGFGNGWKVDRIVAVADPRSSEKKEIRYVVKWKDMNVLEPVSGKVLLNVEPEMLLEYLESCMEIPNDGEY